MTTRIVSILLFLILSGCAGVYQPYAPSYEQFGDRPVYDLAREYRFVLRRIPFKDSVSNKWVRPSPDDRDLLAKYETMFILNGMSRSEIDAAKAGRIFIGMTQLGLFIAKGRAYDENRTETAYAVSIQHIFSDMYVYTDNGIVTAIQSR